MHFAKESLEKAEEHLLKGLELWELTNLYSWNFVARLHLGEIYFETRDFPKSKEHYEKGIRVLEHNRALPSWTNLQKVGFARSKEMDKEKDVN